MITDVLVVGGGPAGSVTALLMARAGFAVTLLERQRFPRAKPCGDCLSPAANRILARIGALDDVLRAEPALLDGWMLTAPGGSSFSAAFTAVSADPRAAGALALRRDIFDNILLEHARRAGVEVLYAHATDLLRTPGGKVTGVRARHDDRPLAINARLTVGADGLRSLVARRLNAYHRRPRLRKTSFTVHVPFTSDTSLGEMRLTDGACLGIAPVQAGVGRRIHNITLVLNRDSFQPHAGAPAILRDGLNRFGLPAPDLGDVEILTSGPFDWPVRCPAFDGAALVGDAAGYYDPFTGEGMYQALAGAELLATHATTALQHGRVDRAALRGYAAAHKAMVGPARRVQRLIEFACSRPQLANPLFARIAQRPEIARALIGVTGDLLPATALFSPRLLMRLVA
jgi:flavin-dependent dehydrogenase